MFSLLIAPQWLPGGGGPGPSFDLGLGLGRGIGVVLQVLPVLLDELALLFSIALAILGMGA